MLIWSAGCFAASTHPGGHVVMALVAEDAESSVASASFSNLITGSMLALSPLVVEPFSTRCVLPMALTA